MSFVSNLRIISKNISGGIGGLLGLKNLIHLSGQNLILPFYHVVSDAYLPHVANLYQYKNRSQFVEDIKYLKKHFRSVDLEELQHIYTSRRPPKTPIMHLSFDDGLRQIFHDIAPILLDEELHATFFLNTKFVNNKGLFYRYKVSLILEELKQKTQIPLCFANKKLLSKDSIRHHLLHLNAVDTPEIDIMLNDLGVDIDQYLAENKPYLDESQVKKLINEKFSIGAHGHDHFEFGKLDFATQKAEVILSFTELESKFNIEKKYFSFPFTDSNVDRQFFSWLYDEFGCQLSFGTAGLKTDLRNGHLQRIPMEIKRNSARQLLIDEYAYFLLKSILKKNTLGEND